MKLGRRMGPPAGAPNPMACALLGGAVCLLLASAAAPACAFGPPGVVPQPAAPAPVAPAAGPVAAGGVAIVVPSTPPTPANLAEARLHFQQGVALFRDQNFAAALAEFRGAYGISGEPVVLYNAGLTFKALFRYSEALDILERYLSERAAHGRPVAKDRRNEVETLVNEMRSLLADVTVVLSPADATLRIDGHPTTLTIVLETPPPPETTPVYLRWWFWSGAAVVAAATVTTILLWPASKQGPLSGTLGIANTTVTTP